MKYMTPQLYNEINSSVVSIADSADRKWNSNKRRYKHYLTKIQNRIPEQFREFLKKDCLHDATVIDSSVDNTSHPPSIYKIFAVHDNIGFVLIYKISQIPIFQNTSMDEFLRSSKPEWMYDEIELLKNGTFQHQIFFSDGKLLNINFFDFFYMKIYESQAAAILGKVSNDKDPVHEIRAVAETPALSLRRD